MENHIFHAKLIADNKISDFEVECDNIDKMTIACKSIISSTNVLIIYFYQLDYPNQRYLVTKDNIFTQL